MKVYSVMMTYNQLEWLGPVMDQFDRALDFGSIDKVYIAEGGHSKSVPLRSPDGSWGYLQERIGKDSRYKLFDAGPFREKAAIYNQVQAPLLNAMCNEAKKEAHGQEFWIFYTHDDEFYLDPFLKNIRNIAINATENNFNMVMTRQMGFAFNFKLYWNKRTCYMLFKWADGTEWKPITTPCYKSGTPYLKVPEKIFFDKEFDHTTFHFSHVKRSERLKYRASKLPSEIGESQASVWYKEIYEQADLNNLGVVYNKNKTIQGGYGFYKDSPDMGPEIMQELNIYDGEYPYVLKEHVYKNIKDIRVVK